MEVRTNSQKQTQKVGADFAKSLKAGDIVALFGDLGAGKTVFVKGMARGLGIKGKITSPTFVFVKTYKLKSGPFHHVDLYRGKATKDFKSLALNEIFAPDAITVVEWADRLNKFLPKKRWEVKIEKIDENKRRITITKH